jgi:hypothetical protein
MEPAPPAYNPDWVGPSSSTQPQVSQASNIPATAIKHDFYPSSPTSQVTTGSTRSHDHKGLPPLPHDSGSRKE